MLRDEVAARWRNGVAFEDGEMVVAVCCAIRRVVGPFQLVMDALLSDPDVVEEFCCRASALNMCKSDCLAT